MRRQVRIIKKTNKQKLTAFFVGSYTEQFVYAAICNCICNCFSVPFPSQPMQSILSSISVMCKKTEMSEEYFFPARSYLHFRKSWKPSWVIFIFGKHIGISFLSALELNLCKFAKIKQILIFSNSYNNGNNRKSTPKPLTNAE